MMHTKCFFSILLATSILTGCGNANTPLDADTRSRIDSISNVRIAMAQREYDSLCKAAQSTILPQLIDSLKKERLQEIQEQLKTVPR